MYIEEKPAAKALIEQVLNSDLFPFISPILFFFHLMKMADFVF